MSGVEGLKAAVALLESRCAAIDLHYQRFPNSLDRTMEDTAKAIRTALSAIEGGGGALQPSASVPTEQADGGVVAALETACRVLRGIPKPRTNDGVSIVYSVSDDVPEDIYTAQSYVEHAMFLLARATPPATPIAGGLGSSPDGDTHRVAETAVVERRPFADVHAEAYGWTLDNDGFLAGLVAGDMGYDHTDLLLSDLLIDAQVAEGRRERTKQGGPYSWPFHDALMALVSTGYAAIQQAAPASDTTAGYEPEASEPKDAARRDEEAGR